MQRAAIAIKQSNEQLNNDKDYKKLQNQKKKRNGKSKNEKLHCEQEWCAVMRSKAIRSNRTNVKSQR